MDKLTFKEWSTLSDLQTIVSLKEDEEFSMARGELKTAKSAIERLMRHLKGEGNLEAWVQSKITKASEYLDTVADHMDSGEDETEDVSEMISTSAQTGRRFRDISSPEDQRELQKEKSKRKKEKEEKYKKSLESLRDQTREKGVRFYDKKGSGYIKDGQKQYDEGVEILDANGNLFAHIVDLIRGSEDKFKGFVQPITEDAVKDLEDRLKKLDNVSYDSIDKLMRNIMKEHDMTAKELHNAFVKKHDKTPDDWIKGLTEKCWDGYKQLGMKKKGKKVVPNCVKEDSIDEGNKSGDSSLRDWFTKSRASDGTPGWVQLGGKYAGKPCAKQPGQTTKPKCGSSKMKADLSNKEEESAFRRKNQEDPNPDRKGKAKMVATEDFKPLPSEKMKNKVASLHKKSLDSDDSDSKKELIRRGGNIRTVSDTIGKSQKTRSFGTKENEKNKSAKYAAKSFLRQHLKSTQNTKDSPDHQGRWNKMVTRTDEGKKKHLEKRAKERESKFGSDHAIKEENISEKKDACYSKVKSRYSVWPSAYASGALVKCRKVGAKNWGNKTKKESFELQEMGELQRYCPKCKKNETMKECRYGEGYWKMFSLPASLAPDPYDPNDIHPANEGVSFDIGSGHKQAQKQAKIRNLATGTTNPNEKSAALRKLSGPSLPLADSVIQPGQLTNEDYQRIQSTGNVYTILFSWRGRPMMNLQLFFPNMKRPSKEEVKTQVEKLYPGAIIMQWYPSPADPSKPIVVIQN
jgi:hypothetical protein